jgi:hypothetical protein
MKRRTFTGLVSVVARCDDCGWTCTGRNAMGLAAQHCDRHAHTVRCEQTIGVTYAPVGTSRERRERQGRLFHKRGG